MFVISIKSNAQVSLVYDINTTPSSGSDPSFAIHTSFNDMLYFQADDGTNGYELWEYDGVNTPTMVHNINPGGSDSNPKDFIEYKGKLYFRADDGTNGEELWVLTPPCTPTTSSISVTECTSYTVPSGDETYTTVGTYDATDTIANSCGADSVTILALKTGSETSTICAEESIVVNGTTYDASNPTGTDVQQACGSYTWIDGNTSTSVSGVTITATTSGATYQWLDCDNASAAITGATNQSYTATVNGNYAVVIDDGLCSDTSACVNINDVGVNELISGDITVYPNPSSGLFTLDISDLKDIELIQVLDIQGKLVYSSTNVNNTQLEVDLSNNESGMYTLIIQTKEAEYRKKLIKQ